MGTDGDRGRRGRRGAGRYGLAAILGLVAVGPTAHPAEVFKYVNPDGTIEYSDRRDGSDRKVTVVDLPKPSVSDQAARAQLEALTEEADRRHQNRALVSEVQDSAARREAERSHNCRAARTDLATLVPAQRPLITDDAGKTVVLDHDAKQRRINELEAAVREFCE